MPDRLRTAVHLLGLAVVAAAAFLPWLGTENHMDGRDALHAEIAREMAVRGDYIVPYEHGKPYTDKTPLFDIVAAALFKLTGRVTLGMARLASALSVVALVLTTYLLGRRWLSVRAAVWAAAMEVTFLLVLKWGMAVRSDTLLAAWVACAVLLADCAAAAKSRRASWLFWAGASLAAGAAVLSKGAVAGPFIVFPVIALWRARRGRWLPPVAYCAAAAVLGALGPVAWAIASEVRSPGHIQGVLGYQFSRTLEEHTAPFYEYPDVLLRNTAPWGLFALGAAWAAIRRARRSGYDRTAIPALSLLACLAALSCLPNKTARYLLPLIPMWALFLAGYLDRAADAAGSPDEEPAPRCLFTWPLVLCLAFVVAAVAGLAICWVPPLGAGRVIPGLAYGAVGVAVAYAVASAWRGKWPAAVGGLLLAVLLVALPYTAATWRLYRKPDPEFALVREMDRAIPPGMPIGAFGTSTKRGSDILFFVLNRPVTFLADSAALADFLHGPGPRYLIVGTPELSRVLSTLPYPPRPIGNWILPKSQLGVTVLAIEP